MAKEFKDRENAGRRLAEEIAKQVDKLDLKEAIALALPRGGVPIAYEVAKELQIPLDVVISRKIGAPFNPEFAVGAISEGGETYLDKDTLRSLSIDNSTLESIIETEKEELKRRIETYRKGKSLPNLKGKTVLLIDDGLATGATAQAALKHLKRLHPKKVIFCIPVGAFSSVNEIKDKVDQVICILKPKALSAVGMYYQNFGQTSDEKVIELLDKSKRII